MLLISVSSQCSPGAGHRRSVARGEPGIGQAPVSSRGQPQNALATASVCREPHETEREMELYRPGMVLALEPKVRSEKSAVHLEEDVLITEKGPEFLTTGCRVLSVVP